jgi:hypothetical protein
LLLGLEIAPLTSTAPFHTVTLHQGRGLPAQPGRLVPYRPATRFVDWVMSCPRSKNDYVDEIYPLRSQEQGVRGLFAVAKGEHKKQLQEKWNLNFIICLIGAADPLQTIP